LFLLEHDLLQRALSEKAYHRFHVTILTGYGQVVNPKIAALQALGEITGETTPEDLLDRIFASFGIGK